MSQVYRSARTPAIIDFSGEQKSDWPTVIKAVLMSRVIKPAMQFRF
jgi:hypothetical protein